MTYKLHPFFDDPSPTRKRCEQTGCEEEGCYRAPRNRYHLKEYFWFCLDHVRSYNEQWNYYRDMSDEDFEEDQRFNETWQRPTWPFTYRAPTIEEKSLDADESVPVPPWFGPLTEGRRSLSILQLSYPYSRTALKKRYIELAKKYHPDANGGSKSAEEQLKSVNRAYEILKKYLQS